VITVIRLLFWTWVLVSVVILAYRTVRRVGGRRTEGDTNLMVTPSLTPEDELRTVTDADRPNLSAPGSAGLLPPGVGPPEGLAGQPTIFDAEPEAEPSDQRPIGELLAGIEMPCGLVPVLDELRRPGSRETVSFSTQEAGATEVGRALGEQLRALGFELTPVTPMHVRATKDGAAIQLEVHPDADLAERAGERLFPFAQPGTVAVEIWR
jgi:hypothetical protein